MQRFIGCSAACLMSITLAVLTLIGCSDSPPPPPGIAVLSNRPDLVSGGDALVEVRLAHGVYANELVVTLNGASVTSAFAADATSTSLVGLVTGLTEGANQLVATTRGKSSQLTITNHSKGGPIFSGPQLDPWVCATVDAAPVNVTVPGTTLTASVPTRLSGLDNNSTDAKCNAPSKITYYYQPKAKEGSACTFTINGTDPCFVPWDTANPPAAAAVANFTNDRGITVRSIVRLERGTMNRGIYQIAAFRDPALPYTLAASQKGWNGKLLWMFGASAAAHRLQAPVTPATAFNDVALRSGFMVATASLNDNGTNANHVLAAETMMMVKEHIVEQYGPIRYTIGNGCSGGSIQQQTIAGSYPGLIDGIQPNCSYQDQINIELEIKDCGLLADRYYRTANGTPLSDAKRSAIAGHLNPNFCAVWVSSFLPAYDPTRAANCGPNFPQALVYDPVLRPKGVRCTLLDHEATRLGTFVDTDGARKANKVFDNVGVQYGLKALKSGAITPEEFLQVNEGVGSYSPDLVWSGAAGGTPAARVSSLPQTLSNIYLAGVLSDAKLLSQVAIIDLRGNQNPLGDIHANWRSWGMRERLDKANGNHNNHVIWASTPGLRPGAALESKSFMTMDKWLAAVETDTTTRSRAEKIVANRPAGLGDLCYATAGATQADLAQELVLGSSACPVTYQASPRQTAGGPLAEDILKCELKPLAFSDADYTGVTFTADQQARLRAVFATGVCDWSKPGVGQQRSPGWYTFATGTGVALPAAPVATPQ